MSSTNTHIDTIVSKIGEVTYADSKFTLAGGESCITDYLKEAASVTDEQLAIISDVQTASSAAISKQVGSAMINVFKEDDTVNQLAFSVRTPIAEFGIDMARPDKDSEGNTSKEMYRASIGSRVTVRGLDSTNEVIDELADMWAAV